MVGGSSPEPGYAVQARRRLTGCVDVARGASTVRRCEPCSHLVLAKYETRGYHTRCWHGVYHHLGLPRLQTAGKNRGNQTMALTFGPASLCALFLLPSSSLFSRFPSSGGSTVQVQRRRTKPLDVSFAKRSKAKRSRCATVEVGKQKLWFPNGSG